MTEQNTAAQAARFKIGDRTYTTASLDEISLRDLMVVNSQMADMGLKETFADIERVGAELAALGPEKAMQHPAAMLMLGVTIWATRRIAGDDVTFEQAVDLRLKDITWLPATGDRKPGPTRPRSGAKKSTARKASAAASGAAAT